jgi:peptidoglycan/xylan/chitin deacetylase (PgdA/CDA1 family)
MYHRVLKKSELRYSFSSRGIIVSDKAFDSHVRYLHDHFNVISIDDLVNHLENGSPIKDSSCLITFDDGWIDNYTNALPILTRYKVPALIFLPTGYIGTNQLFWQEMLASYIHQLTDLPGDHIKFLKEQGVLAFGALDGNDRKRTVTQFIASLKQQSNERIDEVIDGFNNYLDRHDIQRDPKNIDRYVDWNQARIMNKNGICFGSHAISHRLLTKLDDSELEHELTESKNIINSHLGDKVQSIAYPNGNFNDSVINQAENCGYNAGFTTKYGYFRVGDDPLRIKRINIHETAAGNTQMFLCRLLGIF